MHILIKLRLTHQVSHQILTKRIRSEYPRLWSRFTPLDDQGLRTQIEPVLALRVNLGGVVLVCALRVVVDV